MTVKRGRKGRHDAPVVLVPLRPARVPLKPGRVLLMFPRRWQLLLAPLAMPVGVCAPFLLHSLLVV